MVAFRINIYKSLNNEKRLGILKGVMREIAEAVIQWLLEYHLLLRPLKTPLLESRETPGISQCDAQSARAVSTVDQSLPA